MSNRPATTPDVFVKATGIISEPYAEEALENVELHDKDKLWFVRNVNLRLRLLHANHPTWAAWMETSKGADRIERLKQWVKAWAQDFCNNISAYKARFVL